MIGVVAAASKDIDDVKLLADIEWFSKQEASHARAHRDLLSKNDDHEFGKSLSQEIKKVGSFLTRTVSLKINISICSAVEYLTSVLSEFILNQGFFSDLPEETYKTVVWHCREEIEHRAVVFDVMKKRWGDSFWLKLCGLSLACSILCILGTYATAKFWLRANVPHKKFLGEMLSLFFIKEKFLFKTLLKLPPFLVRGFHPSELPLDHLIQIEPN